jgi:hypothetical protein
LYHSGIVQPVTATITKQSDRVLLILTDPIDFFDPALEGQALPSEPHTNSFELVAMRLPFDE